MSQQNLDVEQIHPSKDEAWEDFKERVNQYVSNGSINRSEAEYLFSGFIARARAMAARCC